MPAEIFSQLVEQTEGRSLPDLTKWLGIVTAPERVKGTVNFIAQDAQGHIAAGVSTSGWGLEVPGAPGRLAHRRRGAVR
jgi:isoaspartyl peptidase/L-asparaginase-like protein (Ntn-hydrolase superfamily)